MTALDRARAWFVEPTSPARDPVLAASPAVAAGSEPRHAGADPFPTPGRAATAPRQLGSAVVLGKPGHAEPLAAAVALALCQSAQSRAATVAVIAPAQPATVPAGATCLDSAAACERVQGQAVAADCDPVGVAAAAGRIDPERSTPGGTRAARRLAARLDAHGLPARARGRLAWVRVPAAHREAAARRALLVGAPAVLAVTAPRTAGIEELLAEQEVLVLAMADPAGPLARVAALAAGGIPIAVTRPLPRGPARSLALAGLCAPRAIRDLLASAAMPGTAARAAA